MVKYFQWLSQNQFCWQSLHSGKENSIDLAVWKNIPAPVHSCCLCHCWVFWGCICFGNTNKTIFRSSWVASILVFALFHWITNPESDIASLVFAEIKLNLENTTLQCYRQPIKKLEKFWPHLKSSQEPLNSAAEKRGEALLRVSNNRK